MAVNSCHLLVLPLFRKYFYQHKKTAGISIYANCQNGEGGIWTLAPLLTTYSLSRGAPSATWVLLQLNKIKIYNMVKYHKRRRWDSNPRPLSESPVFKTGSLNHSDTSPKTAWTVYHPHPHLVKHKFSKATSHAKNKFCRELAHVKKFVLLLFYRATARDRVGFAHEVAWLVAIF